MADKILRSRMVLDDAQFKRGLKSSQQATGQFAGAIKSLGPMMAGAFSVTAIVGIGKKLINVNKDFEFSIAKVKAITKANAQEIAQLENAAKKLGMATEFTASQAADLQVEYGKLGFKTQEILDATAATIDLATATGSTLAEAAAVAGSTVRGFGFDAKDTNKVVDIMAESFTSSALNMERWNESMKYVAPVSVAASVSIEETAAMMSILADAGIHGSMAGTALKKMMLELTAGGAPLSEKLLELSQRGITLADANDEVGERAQTALLVLSKQTDRIGELTKQYQGSAGAATQMANVMRNTLKGSIDVLGSSIEALFLQFAGSNGIMRSMVDSFNTFIVSFVTGMDTAQTKFNNTTTAVQGLTKNITPLLEEYEELQNKTEPSADEQSRMASIVQTVAGAIPSAITQFDAYGKAIGISTGKARDFIEAQKSLMKYQNAEAIDELEKKVSKLTKQIQFQSNTITRGTWMTDAGTWVAYTNEELTVMNNNLAGLGTELKGAEDSLKLLSGDIESFLDVPDSDPVPVDVPVTVTPKIATGDGKGSDKLKDIIEDQQRNLYKDLQSDIDSYYKGGDEVDAIEIDLPDPESETVAKWKEAYQSIYAFAQGAFDNTAEGQRIALDKQFAQLEEFKGLISPEDYIAGLAAAQAAQNEWLKSYGDFYVDVEAINMALSQTLQNLAMSVVDSMAQMLEAMAAGEKFDLGGAILTAIGGFMTDFGKAMISIGVIGQVFDKALKSMQWYVALGAGVALVAAGAVLRGIAKKGVGMAEGGIVPEGFPGDTYPARLTSGEMVIPPHKLDSVMGGREVVVMETVVRGQDIYLVQQKQASKMERYK